MSKCGSALGYLKSYIIELAPPPTHKCARAVYDEKLGALIAEGAILNEYIVAGRYPGDIFAEGIDDEAAKEALKAVEQIRSRVQAIMAGE